MKVLTNTILGISVELSEGADPKEVLRAISDQGHAGSIGLISLRNLLTGSVAEANDYVILEKASDGSLVVGDTVDMTIATNTDIAATLEVPVAAVEVTEVVSDGRSMSEVINAAQLETPTAEIDAITPVTLEGEVIPAADAEPSVGNDPAVVSDTVATLAAEPTAAEAAQKVLGINVNAAKAANEPVKASRGTRQRRDMPSELAELSAKYPSVFSEAASAGLTPINVGRKQHRFRAVLAGFGDDHNAPSLRISFLQESKIGIILYVSNRTSGLKANSTVATFAADLNAFLDTAEVKAAVAAYAKPVDSESK